MSRLGVCNGKVDDGESLHKSCCKLLMCLEKINDNVSKYTV